MFAVMLGSTSKESFHPVSVVIYLMLDAFSSVFKEMKTNMKYEHNPDYQMSMLTNKIAFQLLFFIIFVRSYRRLIEE